jgi:LlaMI restriction endonuclease
MIFLSYISKSEVFMTEKEQIIALFNQNVKGKKSDSSQSNVKHDGKDGHWLERAMGIKANASNSPDLLGYEMKNGTKNKTSFGDWSANYYIFRNKEIGIDRNTFLKIFGKPNMEKEGRLSWSGEPVPKISSFNRFGQKLELDDQNNIHAKYSYSKDQRTDKHQIVPAKLQIENLTIARWDAVSLKKKVENKFNQRGWFQCLKDSQGTYISIVFGSPISFEQWIALVKTGEVFFDSGMYQGNIRPYSQWRAANTVWDKLIVSKH